MQSQSIKVLETQKKAVHSKAQIKHRIEREPSFKSQEQKIVVRISETESMELEETPAGTQSINC